MAIVRTKEEFKRAAKSGEHEIIVMGSLADTVRKAYKVQSLSKAALAAIGALAVATPFTYGVSGIVAVGLTGMELATIIFVIFVGVTLILAVLRDYEEIEASPGKVVLRKKKA
ncbi:hypothetical protein [Cupriavidus sp. a3]|uniref:hypothetical protein n=1 Tax=Cupriavidus sp. a3 TaxID=3242158 RepID=UPI003D9C5DDC